LATTRSSTNTTPIASFTMRVTSRHGPRNAICRYQARLGRSLHLNARTKR
jgi:hypothetical protein